jgi:hypothetical protein
MGDTSQTARATRQRGPPEPCHGKRVCRAVTECAWPQCPIAFEVNDAVCPLATAAAPQRRVVPVPPDGWEEFAARVMAGFVPAVVIIDRAFMIEVARYTEALERYISERHRLRSGELLW